MDYDTNRRNLADKIDFFLVKIYVERFSQIRQELQKDLGDSQMFSRRTNGAALS